MKIEKSIGFNAKVLLTATVLVLLFLVLGFSTGVGGVAGGNAVSTGVTPVISENDLVDAGVTPDSIFYWMDRLLEEITLALTFDESSELDLRLQIAEERLSELLEMINNGDFNYIEQSQKDYQEVLDSIKILIEEFDGREGSLDASSEVLKKAIRLELETDSHAEKAAFIKGIIIGKISNSNLSEEQIAKILEDLDGILLKISEIERVVSEKVQKVELREQAISGLSDEQIAQIRIDVAGGVVVGGVVNPSGNISLDNNSTNSTIPTNGTIPDNSSITSNETGNESSNQMVTRLEVKGNILLSNESKSVLDSLMSSFEGTQNEVELKLKIKNSGDSAMALEDKVKGNPTEEQLNLLWELKSNVFLDIQSAEGEVEIKIEIKRKLFEDEENEKEGHEDEQPDSHGDEHDNPNDSNNNGSGGGNNRISNSGNDDQNRPDNNPAGSGDSEEDNFNNGGFDDISYEENNDDGENSEVLNSNGDGNEEDVSGNDGDNSHEDEQGGNDDNHKEEHDDHHEDNNDEEQGGHGDEEDD